MRHREAGADNPGEDPPVCLISCDPKLEIIHNPLELVFGQWHCNKALPPEHPEQQSKLWKKGWAVADEEPEGHRLSGERLRSTLAGRSHFSGTFVSPTPSEHYPGLAIVTEWTGHGNGGCEISQVIPGCLKTIPWFWRKAAHGVFNPSLLSPKKWLMLM